MDIAKPTPPIEPIEFAIRIADFDLSLLPIDRSLLEESPELLKDAVSTFFAEYFAKVGGRAAVVSTHDVVTVSWAPDSLKDKDALIGYTTELLNRGAYGQVEPILRKMADLFPDDFVVHLNMGMMLSNQGRLNEAIAMLEAAAKLSPGNADAWVALGVACDRKGDRMAARKALGKAVELEPNNPHALMNLGGVLMRADPHQALVHLKTAAELLPESQTAAFNYAQCLVALRKPAEADAALGRVIALAPYTELASRAEDQRRQLANMAIHSQSVSGLRPDIVQFCADALRAFAGMDNTKRQAVLYEIAMQGKQGYDVHDVAKKYELKSIGGKFSGIQLTAYLYVGIKRMDPALDPGIDFRAEYEEALRIFQGPGRSRTDGGTGRIAMDQSVTPMSYARWDPSNLPRSFQSFAIFIHQQAKGVFRKDTYHTEMFFFMPVNGKGHIRQWHKHDDRDTMVTWIQAHIREHETYGLIHVCECWARFAVGPNDHTLKQIIDGEMRVSELRAEDRTEALSVTAQSRDGYSHTWIDEIVRTTPAGSPRLDKCRQFDGGFEGRFGNLFG